jgi:hypothetical protein
LQGLLIEKPHHLKPSLRTHSRQDFGRPLKNLISSYDLRHATLLGHLPTETNKTLKLFNYHLGYGDLADPWGFSPRSRSTKNHAFISVKFGTLPVKSN